VDKFSCGARDAGSINWDCTYIMDFQGMKIH